MRNLCLKIVLLLVFLPGFGFSQGSVQPQATQGPTTHILAIGRFTRVLSADERTSIMPREASETLRLILAGKIDQGWLRQDARGPVFLMNVTSVAEAHALLDKLPLGQAKLMEFDLLPVGPLGPLGLLLSKP
jgi:hypothetical protein